VRNHLAAEINEGTMCIISISQGVATIKKVRYGGTMNIVVTDAKCPGLICKACWSAYRTRIESRYILGCLHLDQRNATPVLVCRLSKPNASMVSNDQNKIRAKLVSKERTRNFKGLYILNTS
jgi:hypothetical protein